MPPLAEASERLELPGTLGQPDRDTLKRSSPRAPRAMYLQEEQEEGSGTPPFFALLHAGVAPLKPTAVLICPPFGWEDMCSYRARRDWAEHLARAGHTTLRIDFPGSGDSAGGPTDPGQLDAWTHAVSAAARWLGRAEGVERVAVIGLGLGGIVACRAALLGAPIDELVLWSVPARGRRLLRELRTFAALEVANAPDAGAHVSDAGEPGPSAEPVEDGSLVTNGYLLSADTIADLERLDLQQIVSPAASPPTRRALLLGRDGMKVDGALSGALEQAGIMITSADGPGYGAMMAEPQDARAPSEVFALVSSWLEEEQAGQAVAVAVMARRPAAVATPAGGQGSAADPALPYELRADPVALEDVPVDPRAQGELSACEEIVLQCSGVAVRERPVWIEGPEGGLFGVLAEPLGARRELTGLLLNAGPQRRTGPNRMWVEIARRWAASGVCTLRLDLAGIGDTDGDASALARVSEFYKTAYLEQARAALDALAEHGLPQRFLTLGLCAGCYWAAHTALADERVAAAIMLNPRTLVYDQWRHTLRRTRLLRERMLRPATWRKLLTGEIRLAKHLETGRTLIEQATRTRMRARIAAPGSSARENPVHELIEDLFDALRDRDQRGLLLFTGQEMLHDELARGGVLDRLDRWPNLELEIRGTSADTHTLTPLWLQRQVHELVDRVLVDELARLPGA